jgi:hypothetical protein
MKYQKTIQIIVSKLAIVILTLVTFIPGSQENN